MSPGTGLTVRKTHLADKTLQMIRGFAFFPCHQSQEKEVNGAKRTSGTECNPRAGRKDGPAQLWGGRWGRNGGARGKGETCFLMRGESSSPALAATHSGVL